MSTYAHTLNLRIFFPYMYNSLLPPKILFCVSGPKTYLVPKLRKVNFSLNWLEEQEQNHRIGGEEKISAL